MSRPELQNPPEIFYNDDEARKYTRNSRIMEIQSELSDRALELLALPQDDVPRLLLDIGCGSGLSGETLSDCGHHWIGLDISQSMLDVALENEVKGDLLLGDMGQGLGLRSGVIDGAISISAVQWLCNANKSSHNPRLRLKAFFGSLYRCLARGAKAAFQMYPENLDQRELIAEFLALNLCRAFFGSLYRCLARGAKAAFQMYPENLDQRELIVSSAMRAGFSGGIVVDYPNSSKKRKEYLVLTCGPPSVNTSVPEGKSEDEDSSFDEDSSEDEENQTVSISGRHRPRKRQRTTKKGKGRDWLLKKKDQMRRKGNIDPPDTRYTGRKRKARF